MFPFKVMLVVEVTSSRATGVTLPTAPRTTSPDPALMVNSNSPLVAPPSVTVLLLLVMVVLATKVIAPPKLVTPAVWIDPPSDEVPVTINPLWVTSSVVAVAITKEEIGWTVPDKVMLPPLKLISIGSKPSVVAPMVPDKVRLPRPVLVKLLASLAKLPAQVISCPLVSILKSWVPPARRLPDEKSVVLDAEYWMPPPLKTMLPALPIASAEPSPISPSVRVVVPE